MKHGRSMRALAAIALVSAGLAACSLFKSEVTAATKKDCTRPGLCQVQVTVVNCVPTTHETIVVNKDGGPIEIRWEAPAGYTFTEQGVKFESSPVIDAKPGIQSRGESWTVVDRPNGQKITSKYRLQLKSTASPGTVCTGPDPFIANE